MPKGLKVAAWAAVFVACASVGAYVAAHTNPFPPGVDRPGVSPSRSSSSTPTPTPERWSGTLRSFTYHQLYVGGRCTTRWRGELRFTVDDAGHVRGSGSARLFGGLRCDFPIAQVQARLVRLSIAGRVQGGRLVLGLDQTAVVPAGAQDLGGFVPMLPRWISMPVHGGSAGARAIRHATDDEGRGTYFWSTGLRLTRVSGG